MTRLIWVLPVLLSVQALAQPRGPRPWWDTEVAKDLNLSDAQMKQIRDTQREFRPRMLELRAEVNRAENEVDAAFNEDPVNETRANEAIDHLATARGELTRAVSQMDLRLRTILTAQQWQSLKQKQQQGPWPGRGGGRHRPPTGGTTANQK